MRKVFIISMFVAAFALASCVDRTENTENDTTDVETVEECTDDSTPTEATFTFDTPVDSEGIEIDADCD